MTTKTRPHNSNTPLQYCRVLRTTDQSIPNVTGQPITFTARDTKPMENRDAMWDGATALYATENGIYHVEACTTWHYTSNVGARYIYIVRGGAGVIEAIATGGFCTNNWYFGQTVCCDLAMNDNEYVQLQVYQSSGAALSIVPGTTGWQTSLSLQLVQPMRGGYKEWAAS